MTAATPTDTNAGVDADRAARAPTADRPDIDDALDDSFPASDPPSWWAGGDRPRRR